MMSMRTMLKKARAVFLLAPLACAASCGGGDDGHSPSAPADEAVDDGTRVVFDNTGGLCEALVYGGHERRESDLLAAVPAGASADPLPHYAAESVTFYFSYRVSPRGVDGVSIVWTPTLGKDQSRWPVPAGKTAVVLVPPLDAALAAPDERLSAKTYIIVQNKASFDWYLLKGAAPQTPLDASDIDVIPGQMPAYELDGAAASAFTISMSGTPYPFPAAPAAFEAGCLYQFVFDGAALTLKERMPLVRGNIVLAGQPDTAAPNGPLANTRWKDSEGNGITFYEGHAFLSGTFWHAFENQTLESAYRAAQEDVIIYINKDGGTGFRLVIINKTTITNVPSSGPERPFYKESGAQ